MKKQGYMSGDIVVSIIDYYDLKTNLRKFKTRPCMIVAPSDKTGDYVVLPISTISRKDNINPIYDVLIDISVYPKLHLTKTSFVRTHKQTIIHKGSIESVISNVKAIYEDLYLEVISQMEAFQKKIVDNAL